MHDVAALTLGSPSAIRWDTARLPARLRVDVTAIHVKAGRMRADEVAAKFRLPGPLERSTLGEADAFWLAPGEWLLLTPDQDARAMRDLRTRAAQSGVAASPCGDRLIVLQLDASNDILARLTGLTGEALGPGRVARTRLADIPVILAAEPDAQMLLIFDGTFAVHLHGWLDRAF